MSSTNARISGKASNEIFIGKKPLMTYVTATLVQLANEPMVVIKARGKSITRAVDVAQIIVNKRCPRLVKSRWLPSRGLRLLAR